MNDRHKINVNDLPSELLAKIFQCLTSHDDICMAQDVCVLWNNIITVTVGVKRRIGNGSIFRDQSRRWYPLMEIGRVGIRDCTFGDVMDNLAYYPVPEEVSFRFPNLVTTLQFEGFMSAEIYLQLLSKPLINLTTLVFHISTLSHINISWTEKAFLLDNLTKLEISSEGFSIKEDIGKHNMQRVYENFCEICESHLKQLRQFKSELPIFLDKEIEVYKKLAGFVIKHSLTQLELVWTERWRVDSSSREKRTQAELDRINDQLLDQPEIIQTTKHPRNWKLKFAAFEIHDRDVVCPTALAFKYAILEQCHLEKLHYLCWNYIPLPVATLRRNSSTLREIALSIDDVAEPLNMSAFSECQNLQRLTLRGDGDLEFNSLAEVPRVQNMQMLPTSIKHLKLRNLLVETESLDWISANLMDLHSLVLINIGSEENLGMSIPCLLRILNLNQTISVLKVKGINRSCHDACFPEPDSSSPVCLICHKYHEEEEKARDHGTTDTEGATGGDCQVPSSEAESDKKEVCVIGASDKALLLNLLSRTSHGSPYLPYHERRDGSWVRICRN